MELQLVYIFHHYKSLGQRDQHRLRTKKKLLDRKTEEAVSLAQNSGRSDLILLWCQAPDNVRPPPPSPPPQSEAAPFEELEALDIIEKKRKKKRRRSIRKHVKSPWGPHMPRVQGLLKRKKRHHLKNRPLLHLLKKIDCLFR